LQDTIYQYMGLKNLIKRNETMAKKGDSNNLLSETLKFPFILMQTADSADNNVSTHILTGRSTLIIKMKVSKLKLTNHLL